MARQLHAAGGPRAARQSCADAVATARRLADGRVGGRCGAGAGRARNDRAARAACRARSRFRRDRLRQSGREELGFASDLDLVFVYDGRARRRCAATARAPLEGARWYARLAQRVVNWLSTPTRGGRLYEVDTRLRPDGSKGLLVAASLRIPITSANAPGPGNIRRWCAHARSPATNSCATLSSANARGVLGQRANPPPRSLRSAACARNGAPSAIVPMRRVRSQARAGGLLDIEFLLQGLVLLHAARHPDVMHCTDTPGLIGACEPADALSPQDARVLREAHARLLARALACTLDARSRVVPREEAWNALTAQVTQVARAAGFDFFRSG